MQRIFKWLGIILGILILLIAVAAAILHFYGASRLASTPPVTIKVVAVPGDEAAIERGAQLAVISACAECHGEGLKGKVFIDESPIGYVTAPNLTTGLGGIGRSYTDEDWAGAIRHGVAADGRTLVVMPSHHYADYSDTDLGKLIAYLKSVPPTDNELGPRAIMFPGTIIFGVLAYGDWAISLIDHAAVGGEGPAADTTPAYGKYLVSTASCGSCHGEDLAGNPGGNDAPVGPNLTPGGDLGSWSEENFFTAMRTGQTPSGKELSSEMPWRGYGQMTDIELRALWLYLQSLDALPGN